MAQAIAARISRLRPAFKPKPLHVGLCYCNRLFSEHSGSAPSGSFHQSFIPTH